MSRLQQAGKTRSTIVSLFFVLLAIYGWLAFVPIPKPITVGLDPSWSYAISRAAVEGLIFGKDIIFTYGPLGYLVAGASIKENFFILLYFGILINLAFWIISIIRISSLQTIAQKISLSLSLFVPYFLWGFALDYQILLIFIIFLSFEKLLNKSLRWWSVGLGGIAGFCLLTKFTLGIGTFGSLFLYILGNLWDSIKSKSSTRIRNSIFCLINSLLATISVSFVLLNTQYYLLNFKKILFCLIVSGIIGIIFYKSRNKVLANISDDLAVSNEYNSRNSRLSSEIIGWSCFYIIYSF